MFDITNDHLLYCKLIVELEKQVGSISKNKSKLNVARIAVLWVYRYFRFGDDNTIDIVRLAIPVVLYRTHNSIIAKKTKSNMHCWLDVEVTVVKMYKSDRRVTRKKSKLFYNIITS